MEWTLKLRKIRYVKEYVFLADRKFRFDFYFEHGGKKIGIEYDGLTTLKNAKSRHTTKSGFSRDTTKTNLAQLHGYIVLRYTALTYQNLEKDLKTLMDGGLH